MDPMRVLVADDHPLYREAVRLRIERLLPAAEVVEAGSLDDVLAALAPGTMAPAASRFDLVLLDLHIADTEPEASARAVIEAAQTTPVLLMSGSASSQTIKRAIGYGARGFLPKTMGSDLFAAAISMVLSGGSYLPVEILQDTPSRRRRDESRLTEEQDLDEVANRARASGAGAAGDRCVQQRDRTRSQPRGSHGEASRAPDPAQDRRPQPLGSRRDRDPRRADVAKGPPRYGVAAARSGDREPGLAFAVNRRDVDAELRRGLGQITFADIDRRLDRHLLDLRQGADMKVVVVGWAFPRP